MREEQPGRAELGAWWDSRATNYYDATPNLARVLRRWAGDAAAEKMEPTLREFGAVVATVVEPAVVTLEAHRELPAHIRDDGIGRPLEAIEFHPAYEVAGRAIWGSGMLTGGREGPQPFELTALFYLLTHAGEGGTPARSCALPAPSEPWSTAGARSCGPASCPASTSATTARAFGPRSS